jgi:hypothetical protein
MGLLDYFYSWSVSPLLILMTTENIIDTKLLHYILLSQLKKKNRVYGDIGIYDQRNFI